MPRRAAILPLLALACGCAPAPPAGIPQIAWKDSRPRGEDGPAATPDAPGVALGAWLADRRSPAISIRLAPAGRRHGYRVAYATTEVATLAVGLFDRSAARPVFGFFYPAGGPATATNPLSGPAFAALRAALGSQVPVGGADKTDPRRYLFRTIPDPAASLPAVRLRNFPRLTGGSPARAYNLFACALDSYDQVIGYQEKDLTEADLAAATVSLTVRLDHGGLGALTMAATVSGTAANPLPALSSLLVGVFDAGSTPRLGRHADGTASSAFAGSQAWFPALRTFLAGQGLGDDGNTRRYCIREFPAPVAGGAMAVSAWNLPPGGAYRPFILALRDGTTNVGNMLGNAATVSAGATASVDLGSFTTQ